MRAEIGVFAEPSTTHPDRSRPNQREVRHPLRHRPEELPDIEHTLADSINGLHALIDEVVGPKHITRSIARADQTRFDIGVVRDTVPHGVLKKEYDDEGEFNHTSGLVVSAPSYRAHVMIGENPDGERIAQVYETLGDQRTIIEDEDVKQKILDDMIGDLVVMRDETRGPYIFLNGKPYLQPAYSVPLIDILTAQSVDRDGKVVQERKPLPSKKDYIILNEAKEVNLELLPTLKEEIEQRKAFRRIHEPAYCIDGVTSADIDLNTPASLEILYDRDEKDEFGRDDPRGPYWTLTTILSPEAHQSEYGNVAQLFGSMNIDWAIDRADQTDMLVRFNLSPRTLLDPEIQQKLRDIPEGVNLEMEVLECEKLIITNENREAVRETLLTMQANGIRTAIDDFSPEGVDDKNFSHHNAREVSSLIDIDEIKIDPRLVYPVAYNETDLKNSLRTVFSEALKFNPKAITVEGLKLMGNIDTIHEVMDEFIAEDPDRAHISINIQSRDIKPDQDIATAANHRIGDDEVNKRWSNKVAA